MFDNLPGAGEPIADLHQRRPPGWWSNRFLKQERSKLKRAALEERLTRERARLWRLADQQSVRARVAELNRLITDYNTVTGLEPHPVLDEDEIVATWRRLGLASS